MWAYVAANDDAEIHHSCTSGRRLQDATGGAGAFCASARRGLRSRHGAKELLQLALGQCRLRNRRQVQRTKRMHNMMQSCS
jgi:hypothetical protein